MLSRGLLTCRVTPSDGAGPARPAWAETPPCSICRPPPCVHNQPAVLLVPHTQEHQPRVELLKEKRGGRSCWKRQAEGQFYDKEEEKEVVYKEEEEEEECNSPSSSHSSSESKLRLFSWEPPISEDGACVLQPGQCSPLSLCSRVASQSACLPATSAESLHQPLSASSFSSSSSSSSAVDALVKLAESGAKEWYCWPCCNDVLNAALFSLSGCAALSTCLSSLSSLSLSSRSSRSSCESTEAGLWPPVPTRAALSLTTNTLTTPRLSHQRRPCSLVFNLLPGTEAAAVVDSGISEDRGLGGRPACSYPPRTSQTLGSQSLTCSWKRTGGGQGQGCSACVSSAPCYPFWHPSPGPLPPSPDLQGSPPLLPQPSSGSQGVQPLGDQGSLTLHPQRSPSSSPPPPPPPPPQQQQEALPSPRGDSDTDAQVDSVSSSDLEQCEDLEQ